MLDTDTTWKIFSHTGNIETYLLLKELEGTNQTNSDEHENVNDNESETFNEIY